MGVQAAGAAVRRSGKTRTTESPSFPGRKAVPQVRLRGDDATRRVVPLVPRTAAGQIQLFGISVDELLGLKNGTGKRGPTPLLQKQIERLNRLPRTQQKVVMQMLDGVLSQASR